MTHYIWYKTHTNYGDKFFTARQEIVTLYVFFVAKPGHLQKIFLQQTV